LAHGGSVVVVLPGVVELASDALAELLPELAKIQNLKQKTKTRILVEQKSKEKCGHE